VVCGSSQPDVELGGNEVVEEAVAEAGMEAEVGVDG
jgi:hypothetical protein